MGTLGKNQLDYAQVFAALGHFISKEELSNTCVLEFEGGVIVTGTKVFTVGDNLARHTITRVFSEDELKQLTKGK
jgi:hypothetical protein